MPYPVSCNFVSDRTEFCYVFQTCGSRNMQEIFVASFCLSVTA